MDVKGRKKHALMCKVYKSKLVKTCTVPNPRVGAKRQLVSIYSIYRIYWKPVSAAAMHKICSLGSVELVIHFWKSSGAYV